MAATKTDTVLAGGSAVVVEAPYNWARVFLRMVQEDFPEGGRSEQKWSISLKILSE